MASEAAIAEGGDIVTSTQIDYTQKLFSHPDYRFEPQFPNTFGLKFLIWLRLCLILI